MARKTTAAAARQSDSSAGTGAPDGRRKRGRTKAPPPTAAGPPPPIIPLKGGGLACFAGLSRSPQEWLLPGLVPRGAVVMLAGNSDTGKSTFCAAMAAHCSGGRWLDLDGRPDPLNVLYYGAEADPTGETLDRLCAAEVQSGRCFCGDLLHDGRPAPKIYLPDGIAALRDRVRGCRAGLVIFDPLASYVASGIRPGDGQSVRELLLTLQLLARDEGVTVLFVAHNRKSRTGQAADWVSGHKEWWNVPRQILCFGEDPQEGGRYVLAVGKSSRARRAPSRYYTLEPAGDSVRFHLAGQAAIGASDLASEQEDKQERGARTEAKAYLRLMLEEGERRQKDLIADATANGVAVRTLRRAADDLGVTHHLTHVSGDVHWVWRRPEKWPD